MPNLKTLLITDDCPEDREVFREYLLNDPHQPYRILEAGSAELGLALCQKEHCDAILLDFCLPDMSGLEFLDQLKQQQLETSLPVIMLTGQGDESIAVQAMKRGAQDYLVKQHLQSDILQITVRNVIERSSLRARHSQVQEPHDLVDSIALRIRQSLNLEHVLQAAVTEVQHLLECDRVVIYQMTPSSVRALTKVCEAGVRASYPDPIQQFMSFLVEQSQSYAKDLTGSVPREQRQSSSRQSSSRQSSVIVSRNRRQPQTYLLTPIAWSFPEAPAPQLWGVLVACQGSGDHQWQLDEVNLLNELSGQLAVAIQQAEQLSQTAAALEHEKQLNAVQSQMTIALSHAYRTPLASILAAASTLRQQGDRLDNAKQQRFLQIIEDKVRQMSRLVDDLLILKKLELGKAAFNPLPFNLLQFFADLVEEQQETLKDHANNGHANNDHFNNDHFNNNHFNNNHPDAQSSANSSVPHELILKVTGNTKGFWGDQDLLRQILVNLLLNAVKYSPNGSPVEVHLSGNESQIIFSVHDQGIGIPTEDQENLFQAFDRGSNVGEIPGTGLGLAIVKTCVELHGGDITIASQEEQGTTVTVRLPKR